MLDLFSLIEKIGYVGLFAIIFAESGFFLGWFLPGDSLLITAGILSSLGYLQIVPVIVICFFAAVLGDSFGYWFGKKVGHKIFTKEDSLVFAKDHIRRAEEFYAKHGNKTIVIARFFPIIRTIAPIMAGVGRMNYQTFLFYNVFGALAWAVGNPLLGYYLGNSVPGIHNYIIWIIAGILFLSALPTIIHILKTPAHRQRIWALLTRRSSSSV